MSYISFFCNVQFSITQPTPPVTAPQHGNGVLPGATPLPVIAYAHHIRHLFINGINAKTPFYAPNKSNYTPRDSCTDKLYIQHCTFKGAEHLISHFQYDQVLQRKGHPQKLLANIICKFSKKNTVKFKVKALLEIKLFTMFFLSFSMSSKSFNILFSYIK